MHKGCERSSNRKHPQREKIISPYKERYGEFGPDGSIHDWRILAPNETVIGVFWPPPYLC